MAEASEILPSVDMYPSLQNLLDSYTNVPVPPGLVAMLYERYNKHGMEYASDLRRNGRIVNRCMARDSAEDAREELVDAVFNLLVVTFKHREGYLLEGAESWRPNVALGYALRAWATLSP